MAPILAEQLRSAFESFAETRLAPLAHRARERELVSMFAFGPLLDAVRPGAPLSDPRQIGIEVAVPQQPGGNRKADVCKDLVIWPEPNMTCWSRSAHGEPCFPSAVIEWKLAGRDGTRGRAYDHAWLSWFVGASPAGSQGYSVWIALNARRRIEVHRFVQGAQQADWFVRDV